MVSAQLLPVPISVVIMEETNEKILRYERFLNDTLKTDLRNVLEQRDKIYEEISEYLKLKPVIARIQESEDKTLKAQVNLGCNFYVQAKVHDTSRIYVCVGFGFFVEFTLNEAVKFIDKKVAHLESKGDLMTKDACNIKAHIKVVIEGLREIQGISDAPAERPRRDIF